MSGLHYTKSGALDMRYSSSRAAVASGYGSGGRSNSGYSSNSSCGDSGLHYTKSGALDMRYSSSRAAVASGYGSGGRSNSGYSSNSSCGDSGLHYTKSGALDMRYSSSRAAVASGYGSGGRSNSGYSSNSSCGDSGLHYTKSGALDMRYSSSRAAVASNYGGEGRSHSGYGGNSSSSSVSSSGNSSGLHYKSDGSLDMRYSSSKAAVSSGSSTPPHSSVCSDLHYKKDGTLDMRYRSSQSAAATAGNTKKGAPAIGTAGDSTDHHYKKDGTLDMRFKSSKALAKEFTKLGVSVPGIPSNIPLTKAGLPDMRVAVAKDWVKQEAEKAGGTIPSWVPTMKDGSINTNKISPAIMKVLQEGNKKAVGIYHPKQRRDYYDDLRQTNKCFEQLLEKTRKQQLPPLPNSNILEQTQQLKRSLAQNQLQALLPVISPISYTDLELKPHVIGRGGFGVVLKGTWNGKVVAVKQAHLPQLTRKEKIVFLNEVKILGYLGEHTNLVRLYAFVLDPPCLVLEFVELGSLSHLLHYEEDPEIQVNMTDGRIKQQIVLGVAHGMIQLHEVGVVHGDLKPQNILITKDYIAKITDFGLATIRGKISSSVASTTICDDDNNIVAGTGAYMAPELLDSTAPPELSSDVYSFAVVINEVLSEEEPYCDQCSNFYGRGPFGVVNYAKLGNRPTIMSTIPPAIKQLINSCWAKEPEQRPTFKTVASELQKPELKFPDFI